MHALPGAKHAPRPVPQLTMLLARGRVSFASASAPSSFAGGRRFYCRGAIAVPSLVHRTGDSKSRLPLLTRLNKSNSTATAARIASSCRSTYYTRPGTDLLRYPPTEETTGAWGRVVALAAAGTSAAACAYVAAGGGDNTSAGVTFALSAEVMPHGGAKGTKAMKALLPLLRGAVGEEHVTVDNSE